MDRTHLAHLSVASVIVFALLAPAGTAQDPIRLASDPPGPEGANAYSRGAVVSGNGRFVAYSSAASNLVVNDTNDGSDVFVFDLFTGQISRESLTSGGFEGNGVSAQPTLSFDARYVAFTTSSQLDPGGAPSYGGVWVRDRVQDTTTLVSVGPGGVPGEYGATEPSISADGRFVVFRSGSSNLVLNDTNFLPDIFVADRQAGSVTRVNVDASGAQANGNSGGARVSSNGRWIVFASMASNLSSTPDVNGVIDVFVFDRLSGGISRESVSTAGQEGNGHSGGMFDSGGHTYDAGAISDDGRHLVFESLASNLVAGDTNGHADVFLRDRAAGTTTRISLAPGGMECDGDALFPRISGDGRFVVYNTGSTNMVLGDALGWDDVFVFDRLAGTTSFLSRSTAGGVGNFSSWQPAISQDGRTIVFQSSASDLVVDDQNGGIGDVFAVDHVEATYTSYCYGDGSGFACPCGNYGFSARGCDNSFATGGAALVAQGLALVGADSLRLDVTGLPSTTTCLFFQGTAPINGGAGAAFGDGLRCAGGVTVRLGSKTASMGAASYGAPLGDAPISVRGAVPPSGGLFHYQAWYRNAAAFCTPSTFNLSNALSIPWL